MQDTHDESEDGGGHGKQAPPVPVAPSSSGATSSNTAPVNCNTGGLAKILRVGIDSLYLSYPGRLFMESEIKLQRLKELAQSENPIDKALSIYPFEAHLFEVLGKGSGYYPYVMQNNAYRFHLSSTRSKQLPLAYVQVRSQWLTGLGVDKVVDDLHLILAKLGQLEEEAQVSRADLHVDFISAVPIDEIQIGQFVSRAKRVSTHTINRRFTGYSIGLGGNLSARLYDKTEELKESNKDYIIQLWKEAGYQDKAQVYRLEFQFKRTILVEHQVKTVPELLLNLGRLWRYATLSWLKLTIPSKTDSTQSRWPIHPLWVALSEVEWSDTAEGTSIPVRTYRSPSPKTLFENGISGITSFMACRGITDPVEAFKEYFNEAKMYHNDKRHFTGIDFDGYLQEKAAHKAKKYNIHYPGIKEKTEQIMREVVAREYRKQKDGE